MDLVASLLLEDARPWGTVAADWQIADAAAILEPVDGGPLWHFLTRPRGGSKTTDLAAVMLAWLMTSAAPGARGYLAASDADQAGLVIDAAAGFVSRTPALRQAVRVETARLVAVGSGASVTALAADGPSAFGLRPAFVVADEVAQWPATRNARQLWTALVSAMGKVPGSRLVVLTSAGAPSHWSHAVLAEARRSDRWRVHEVPGPLPWVDPANLAGQRALLRPSEYARLHLNEWAEAEDSLVDPGDLEACVTLDGPLPFAAGRKYVVAVDLGLKNDRTVAAVCHGEPSNEGSAASVRVVLDRMQVWQGSRRRPVRLADVEDWLVDASARFGRPAVIFDPWQSVGMQQRLAARGVTVREFTFTAQSVGRLASTLALLLRNRLLALPRDEALLAELAGVRLRETSPGVVRLDHDSDGHDDRAVTLGMAASELLAAPVPPAFVFDDDVPVEGGEPVGESFGAFGVRTDPATAWMFAEDRHPLAGKPAPSPYTP